MVLQICDYLDSVREIERRVQMASKQDDSSLEIPDAPVGIPNDLTEHFTRTLGLRVSTTTNGTPLGSAVVRDHILEHYSELTVSVEKLDLR